MQEVSERAGRPRAEGALRVVLAGGGTGGHLYPALAVAEKVSAGGGQVLFVGTRRGLGARVVPERGFQIAFVRARGLGGGPVGLALAAFEIGLGFLQSLVLLLRERPNLVIGTGGYVCVPVVLAAAVLRIPAILLEQNALPGKATRFLSRFARRVCVSLPGGLAGLPADRVEVTGNPIRQEILERDRSEARRRLGLAEGRTCLLVTGASQGAGSLNRAVLRALPQWRECPWTVLHLTGPGHLEEVQVRSSGILEGARLEYRPIGYLEDIAELYAAADLVVCRAGATTLAEITARGLASVLVPYPHAAEGHQEKNAEVLVEQGAALLLEDRAVEEELGKRVEDLLARPDELASMSQASLRLGHPEAAASVLEVALREARWAGAAGPRGTTAGPGCLEERGR